MSQNISSTQSSTSFTLKSKQPTSNDNNMALIRELKLKNLPNVPNYLSSNSATCTTKTLQNKLKSPIVNRRPDMLNSFGFCLSSTQMRSEKLSNSINNNSPNQRSSVSIKSAINSINKQDEHDKTDYSKLNLNNVFKTNQSNAPNKSLKNSGICIKLNESPAEKEKINSSSSSSRLTSKTAENKRPDYSLEYGRNKRQSIESVIFESPSKTDLDFSTIQSVSATFKPKQQTQNQIGSSKSTTTATATTTSTKTTSNGYFSKPKSSNEDLLSLSGATSSLSSTNSSFTSAQYQYQNKHLSIPQPFKKAQLVPNNRETKNDSNLLIDQIASFIDELKDFIDDRLVDTNSQLELANQHITKLYKNIGCLTDELMHLKTQNEHFKRELISLSPNERSSNQRISRRKSKQPLTTIEFNKSYPISAKGALNVNRYCNEKHMLLSSSSSPDTRQPVKINHLKQMNKYDRVERINLSPSAQTQVVTISLKDKQKPCVNSMKNSSSSTNLYDNIPEDEDEKQMQKEENKDEQELRQFDRIKAQFESATKFKPINIKINSNPYVNSSEFDSSKYVNSNNDDVLTSFERLTNNEDRPSDEFNGDENGKFTSPSASSSPPPVTTPSSLHTSSKTAQKTSTTKNRLNNKSNIPFFDLLNELDNQYLWDYTD